MTNNEFYFHGFQFLRGGLFTTKIIPRVVVNYTLIRRMSEPKRLDLYLIFIGKSRCNDPVYCAFIYDGTAQNVVEVRIQFIFRTLYP